MDGREDLRSFQDYEEPSQKGDEETEEKKEPELEQEEQEEESEISDHLVWSKEQVDENDLPSIFFLKLKGTSQLFELWNSEFPLWYLISVKHTLISSIPLAPNILVSQTWLEEEKECLEGADNLTSETSGKATDVNKPPRVLQSNDTDSDTSSLFDDSDCPLPVISAPSTSPALIVQMIMDREMKIEKMTDFLQKWPLEFQTLGLWYRDATENNKSSTFILSFKESYDLFRFLEADISFPFDSILSLQSTSDSATSLSENILNYDFFKKTRTLFKIARFKRLTFGFTATQCDLKVKLIMDPNIDPKYMENFIKKSRYVLSGYQYRTLCKFVVNS